MKLHSRPQLKLPALEIGIVPPGDGQCGLRLRRFVPAYQPLEREGGQILLRGELGRIERGQARLHLYAQSSAVMRTRGRGGGC